MISKKRSDQDAAKRFLAVGALVFAALTLALSAAPATVLADSAAEQYTEPQLPQKPPDRGDATGGDSDEPSGNGNGGAGNGGAGNGGAGSTDSSGPDSSFTEPGNAGSAAVPGGQDGSGSGAADRNDGASESKGGAGASEKRELKESEATLFGSGGNDDDGPALWLVVGLVIAIPLLVGGAYYLFRRYGRGRGDVQTQAKVRDAVSWDEGRQKP